MATDYKSWERIINRGNELKIVGTNYKLWPWIIDRKSPDKGFWAYLGDLPPDMPTDYKLWPRIINRGNEL